MENLKSLKQNFSQNKISKPEFISKIRDVHQSLFNYAEDLSHTEIKKIEITKNGVFIILGDEEIILKCDPLCTRSAPIEALNFGQYEYHERTSLLKLLKDRTNNPVILDVGANVGYYSIFLCKHFPNSKIFAFEPIPNNFELLQTNLDLNGCTNVKTFNSGLSNTEGDLSFFVDPSCAVNASLKNVANSPNAKKITRPVHIVDSLLAERTHKIDFIKIDVEGAEQLVLLGAKKILQKDRPIVFTEMLRKWTAPFGYHPNDIIKMMKDLKYRCLAVSQDGGLKTFQSMNDETQETNFFFVPED